MNKKIPTVLVVLTVIAMTGFSIATTLKAKVIELGSAVVIIAQVVAINKVDRTLTLSGPEGNIVEVAVGYEVRNFDQVRIGDQVRVEYYEALAMYIGKPGTKPEGDAGLTTARATIGANPTEVMVETVDISATIEKINKKKRKITFKKPDGKRLVTRIGKSVKGFDRLKAGDEVFVRYTKPVAIAVKQL